MKVRSVLELSDTLDIELNWRKQELLTLSLAVKSDNRDHWKRTLTNALICLLYAHWEGFVKNSAMYYLNYVNFQARRVDELHPSFTLLSYAGEIKQNLRARSIGNFCRIFDEAHRQRSQVQFQPENCIDTRSNLDSGSLKDIFFILGIELSDWWRAREKWIDIVLVDRRNSVAHGEKIFVPYNEIIDIHMKTVELLDAFRAAVENAAVLKAYLRQY